MEKPRRPHLDCGNTGYGIKNYQVWLKRPSSIGKASKLSKQVYQKSIQVRNVVSNTPGSPKVWYTVCFNFIPTEARESKRKCGDISTSPSSKQHWQLAQYYCFYFFYLSCCEFRDPCFTWSLQLKSCMVISSNLDCCMVEEIIEFSNATASVFRGVLNIRLICYLSRNLTL